MPRLFFLSVFSGFVTFLVGAFGLRLFDIIDPNYVSWTFREDFMPPYLGLAFEKSVWSDVFKFSYGADFGVPLLFTGATPIYPFLHSFFDLDARSQVFGISYLISLAFMIIGVLFFGVTFSKFFIPFEHLDQMPFLSIFGFIFFGTLNPVFVYNLGHHFNFSWMGFFPFFLAGLLFVIKGSGPSKKFSLGLMSLSVGVVVFFDFYIWTSLFLVVVGATVWFCCNYKRNLVFAITLGIVSILGSVVCMWLSGYFDVDFEVAGACCYGRYGINLLGFIDPGIYEQPFKQWSRLLPDWPGQNGWEVGFIYLGLAGVVGMIVGMKAGFYKQLIPFWAVVCVFLPSFLLALTHNISISGFQFSIPLPAFLTETLSVIRGSGRISWSIYFFVLYFAIGYLFFVRLRQVRLVSALFISLCFWDLLGGYSSIRDRLGSPPQFAKVTSISEFCRANSCVGISAINQGNAGKYYGDFALTALDSGLVTRNVYLARYNDRHADRLNALVDSKDCRWFTGLTYWLITGVGVEEKSFLEKCSRSVLIGSHNGEGIYYLSELYD